MDDTKKHTIEGQTSWRTRTVDPPLKQWQQSDDHHMMVVATIYIAHTSRHCSVYKRAQHRFADCFQELATHNHSE